MPRPIPEDSWDGPIKVTVANPIACIPAKVLFDKTLNERTRMVAALWFFLERRPSDAEIEKHLGYGAASARTCREQLDALPAMEGY